MKVEESKILTVLSMFDKEDIPYIKSTVYIEYLNRNNKTKDKPLVKVKRLGGSYDRQRK